jgi:Putative peptidoglycan binding domain
MKRTLLVLVCAMALIGFGTPAAQAGFRHHHGGSHTRVVVGVGFGGFPSWGFGWGWGYPYYPYGYYPYGYYPYGYGYGYGYGSSYYPYSSYNYGYSSYRPGYSSGGTTSVVVQVQQGLARAGYYHGRVDGVMGSQTRAAIRSYQRAHGMRVDGSINDQLLGTMGVRSRY